MQKGVPLICNTRVPWTGAALMPRAIYMHAMTMKCKLSMNARAVVRVDEVDIRSVVE